MPAQWTADLIGKMHLNNITRKQLAKQLGFHEKYVIMILNGKKSPKSAEVKFNQALNELIEERRVPNEN